MKKKIAIILTLLFPVLMFGQNADIEGLNVLISKAATDTGRINLLLKKVSLLGKLHPDSAILLSNEIAAQSQKINYKEGETQALVALTKLYALKRASGLIDQPANQDSLYTIAMKAAELARKNADRNLEAYNLSLAAASLARQNKFEEAEGMGLHAIGLADSVGSSYNIYQVYAGMGRIYRMEEKYQLAIQYFETAFTKLKDVDFYKPAIAADYEQLCLCYEYTGLPLKALEAFRMYTAIKDSVWIRNIEDQKAGLKLNYDADAKQQQARVEQDKINAIRKVQLNALLVTLAATLLLAIAAFIGYRMKQKANIALNSQKEEIEDALTQLKATQSQLVETEKMATLGELTAGIAHEIQNPLSVVNNSNSANTKLVEELKKQSRTPGTKIITEHDDQLENRLLNNIAQNSQKITQQGRRLDTLVKAMLLHSQGSGGKKELVDINTFTNEYLRIAYHGAMAKDNTFNITTRTNFDPTVGKINIIPQDIGKAIFNLITNAFYAATHKAFDEGPKQILKRVYEPIVWVRTKKNKGFVEISITDNGDGIPQEIADRIFQPFFTTKPADQGTGLGLSTAYDIVKAHGGEIKVESKEGEGSEFIILLPQA